MRNIVGAIIVALLLGVGLWMLSQESVLSPPLVGLLLFVIGGLAGLRVGSDSGSHLMSDMLRLNQILAEQNSALVDQNQMLLKLFPVSDQSES